MVVILGVLPEEGPLPGDVDAPEDETGDVSPGEVVGPPVGPALPVAGPELGGSEDPGDVGG